MGTTSAMRREIDEIPMAARRLNAPEVQDALRQQAAALRELNPAAFITVARGSSDNAATYLKYAIEITAGLPVASLGPSVVTVSAAPLHVRGLAALSISQSGQSPDLVALTQALSDGGAWTLAITNNARSPLGDAARQVLDIHAGPELAVAATKSVTGSILAGLWLVAQWREDEALRDALAEMPDRLEIAGHQSTEELAQRIAACERLIVLGRGPGLGIAGEIALKVIELCGIHASVYSGAEVLHGPSTLLADGFPVLICGDPGRDGWADTAARLEEQGADLIRLPANATLSHPLTDPLLALVPAYAALEHAARLLGRDPDKPALLSKVTSTF